MVETKFHPQILLSVAKEGRNFLNSDLWDIFQYHCLTVLIAMRKKGIRFSRFTRFHPETLSAVLIITINHFSTESIKFLLYYDP